MRLPAIVLLLLLTAFPSPSSEGVWGSRGISVSFVVEGALLYAADGRGVSVYDVSDPASLTRIDVEAGDHESRDLAFMGPLDLVVATTAGVDRFSVASDGSLTRLGSLPVSGGVSRIAAGAGYAAAAAGREVVILERKDDGLRQRVRLRLDARVLALAVVEEKLYVSVEREGTYVFAPPSSEILAALPTAPTAFALSGTRLWAAAAMQGLVEIDVRNASAPKIVRKTVVSGSNPTRVAAVGSRAATITPPDRVDLFDVTAAAEAVATMNEPVRVVALSESSLFLSGARMDGEGMPVENGRPLRAFGLSPAPVLLGEVTDFAGPVSGVWTDGSIAYVVDRPFLRVIDVSKTEEPREIAAIEIPEMQDHIRVKNGFAVLWGRAWVNLVDVSSPLRPRHVGNWHTQGHPPGAATIAGDKVIEANMNSGLHVVDFSDPSQPAQVGGRIWHYRDVAAAEDAVYALQDWGFVILRLENGRTIVDVDRRAVDAVQLEVSRGDTPRFLVAAGGDGLHLYDLADRFAPLETAFLALDESGPAGVSEGAAWIDVGGELFRLDLDAPATLHPTGLRVTAAAQISAAGKKVVVADRYQLRVYGPDTAPPPVTPSRRRGARH